MRNSDRTPRLTYILAPSHSGSTLLSLLLSSHPDVTTVGEINVSALDDPSRYLCSCGEPLRECDFWTAIAARMNGRGIDFDITSPGTDFRRVQSRYVSALLKPLDRGVVLEWCRDAALLLSPDWRAAYDSIQARLSLAGALARGGDVEAARSKARGALDGARSLGASGLARKAQLILSDLGDGDAPGGPWLSPRVPELIARVLRLHSELALNYAAIPLVLDLLARVDTLERRLVEISQVERTASR